MTNSIKAPLPVIPAGKLIREDRCEKCKFSERQSSEREVLECHYNPPTASVVPSNKGPQVLAAFPPVQADQWCGKYKKRVLGGGE